MKMKPTMADDMDETPGPGNPPKSTRWQPGQSGNERGPQKRPISYPPYESVLGQLVTIDGEEITVELALIRHLIGQGTRGDMVANEHALVLVQRIRSIGKPQSDDECDYIIVEGGFQPIVNNVLQSLEMVQKLRADSAAPTILIQPWLVEAALERFGDRQLTIEEQREVWDNTRTPHKVRWPSWWTEYRGTGRRRPKARLMDEDGFYPPCIIPRRADD